MGQASESRSRAPKDAPKRQSGTVLSAVRPLATECANELGLIVWNMEFGREAGRDTLRVEVDRVGAVEAGEVGKFTDRLSKAIDAANAVPGDRRYMLEVSSPGAERKLNNPDQFRICVGRPARITFIDGRPPAEGILSAVDDDSVTLQLDGEASTTRVAFDEISQARLNVPGV